MIYGIPWIATWAAATPRRAAARTKRSARIATNSPTPRPCVWYALSPPAAVGVCLSLQTSWPLQLSPDARSEGFCDIRDRSDRARDFARSWCLFWQLCCAGKHGAHLRSCTCCAMLVPGYISGSERQPWRLLNVLAITKPRAQGPRPLVRPDLRWGPCSWLGDCMHA